MINNKKLTKNKSPKHSIEKEDPSIELQNSVSTHSYIGKKGYTIPKSILSLNELNILYKELTLTPVIECPVSGSPPPLSFPVYRENNNKIYIPRFYGIKRYGKPHRSEICGSNIKSINITFEKPLRDYQEIVVSTYMNSVGANNINTNINTNINNEEYGGGGVLSLYTGAGKTVCAIKIISLICKKTIIIVHKEFLMNQWMERIREFTPDARIGRIQGSVIDIENKDIVLAMMQTLYNEEKKFNLDSFGLCIVDEVHRIGSSQFHKSLFQLHTPYWLGISATVNRKDQMDKLIFMFMGDIIYSIERKGDDFVSVRGINYSSSDEDYNEVPTNYRGEVAYSTLVSKICGYEPRSDFIIRIISDLIQENPKSQILLLGHIRIMLEYMYKKLQDNGVSSGFYVGGMKQCDLDNTANTKQVVLSTYMMSSEALDIPTLSTLVLSSPKTDIIQCVGRILRKKHDTPIIIDIIDSHNTFQNQWSKRRVYYKKCNYKIQKSEFNKYTSVENGMLYVNNTTNDTIWKTIYTPVQINGQENNNDEIELKNNNDIITNTSERKCLINYSFTS